MAEDTVWIEPVSARRIPDISEKTAKIVEILAFIRFVSVKSVRKINSLD